MYRSSPRPYRCGFADIREGKVTHTGRRLWAKHASIVEVSLRRRFRGGDTGRCRLYWHIPLLRPGVLCVDYIHAAPGCHWRDILAASSAIDWIAQQRGCLITVCHVTNDRLSDRVMRRLGFDRHCLAWSGRHFIKRYASFAAPRPPHDDSDPTGRDGMLAVEGLAVSPPRASCSVPIENEGVAGRLAPFR